VGPRVSLDVVDKRRYTGRCCLWKQSLFVRTNNLCGQNAEFHYVEAGGEPLGFKW
jgi:hypothetical protein